MTARTPLYYDGTDLVEMSASEIVEYQRQAIFQYASNTIGIGDGGNEIGMGNLSEEIKKAEGLPNNPAATRFRSFQSSD